MNSRKNDPRRYLDGTGWQRRWLALLALVILLVDGALFASIYWSNH